jgi:hypothetical protein
MELEIGNRVGDLECEIDFIAPEGHRIEVESRSQTPSLRLSHRHAALCTCTHYLDDLYDMH